MGARVDGAEHLVCTPHAIKSQVLANFIAEWTEIQTPPTPIEHETWTMYSTARS
jgi:hypothetical protein